MPADLKVSHFTGLVVLDEVGGGSAVHREPCRLPGTGPGLQVADVTLETLILVEALISVWPARLGRAAPAVGQALAAPYFPH